eukprot:SAG22_NODE_10625_length_524_cov_0.920000_1_plen_155_part_01
MPRPPQAQPEPQLVRRRPPPKVFQHSDHAGILEFFTETGYVVVADALSPGEGDELNSLCDASQAQWPERWSQRAAYPPPAGDAAADAEALKDVNPVLRAAHTQMDPADYKEHAPLLFHPAELGKFTQHPPTWPSVAAILGGEDLCQHVQLDFRES